jgi:hypothetical protein
MPTFSPWRPACRRFVRRLRARAHQDDDALGVRDARRSRRAHTGARSAGEAVHRRLRRARGSGSSCCTPRAPGRRRRGSAPCRAAPGGPASCARSRWARRSILVDHRAEVSSLRVVNLVDLVRGAEAVEEVHERHRDSSVAICATAARSCTSCTEPEHSIAKPVWRHAMTSLSGRRRSTGRASPANAPRRA